MLIDVLLFVVVITLVAIYTVALIAMPLFVWGIYNRLGRQINAQEHRAREAFEQRAQHHQQLLNALRNTQNPTPPPVPEPEETPDPFEEEVLSILGGKP